jgi:maltoporin
MATAIYQDTKDGSRTRGVDRWISFGGRPVFFFSEHTSLAIEAGFDRTSSGDDRYRGWLRKITIAPQIGAGRQFFSRPVLRAFITYADWSDGLKGYVGGVPFVNSTDGFTYGFQTEAWW